jgi:hypothetical protein
MTFRAIPPAVERVLAAARRVHPTHALYVSIALDTDGPPWTFHPYKRWLVLRTDAPGRLLEAVACSLLARHAWLGKGAVTTVPEHLSARYFSALGALLAALGPDAAQAETRP